MEEEADSEYHLHVLYYLYGHYFSFCLLSLVSLEEVVWDQSVVVLEHEGGELEVYALAVEAA